MFSKNEQNTIQEKLGQLKDYKEGKLTASELADLITARRIAWIQEHLDEMIEKYAYLSPEEQAYRIIFLEHMKINPEHSKVTRISSNKIKIESDSFCPYLEACHLLNLDTRHVCKYIGEPSFNKMIKIINPNLKFSRDYDKIRPHNGTFCEEFIELVEPEK